VPPIITNLFEPKNKADWFYVLNSTRSSWRDTDYLESYYCVPELNAVINMKANAFSNGKYKVIDDNLKEYPNEPILEILRNPNWFQGEKEFLKQTKTFRDIFGNEYLNLFFPIGMPDRIKALYTLPPNLVNPEYNETKPFYLFTKDDKPNIRYVLKSDGTETALERDTIVHLNDNRADIKSVKGKKILLGVSKQKALTPAINNIKTAYESRGVILESRGANGALTPDSKDGMGNSTPLLPQDKKDLEDKFSMSYGTKRGQGQVIISNAAMKWVQMGVSRPKDLGLFDETQEDFNKILDAHGVPSELFVRGQGSTFENQNQARKGLYTETIIPEAAEWTTGLSKRVFPDGKKRIILDYMHLPIFQDDMQKRGTAMTVVINALSTALQDGAITIDDYKKELLKFGIGNQNQ